MAEYLGDALFELRANVAPLMAGMAEAEAIVDHSTRRLQGNLAKGLGGFSQKLGQAGNNMTTAFTFPILGIAAASAKMAADFQRAMELIHTQAGAPQKEVDNLKQKVLDLAKAVPYGPTALADALYHLESIGLRTNTSLKALGLTGRSNVQVMNVLKTAADGAAVGHANLEETATALGSAWLVNIKGAGNLRDTMGTLNAAVGVGNMRMQDLVTSLGTGVLPMAKLAGLSLQDVVGALALFSDEGYKSYAAATQMGTALHYLFDPTAKAATALHGIGLSTGALSADLHKPRGLLTALSDLKDHLDKTFPPSSAHKLTIEQTSNAISTFKTQMEAAGLSGKKLTDAVDKYKVKLKEAGSAQIAQEQVLGDIFPAGRGRVLLVLMNQLDRYKLKLDQVQSGQKKFGDDVQKTMDLSAIKGQQAWARIQSDMTSFGDKVLPPLLDLGTKVADLVDKVATAFGKLNPQLQKEIISGGLVFVALGPAMRIMSFFLGGVTKLLSAATIASRLAGGQGWKQAFSGTAPTTPGGAGKSLMEIAEMKVAQMTVAELITKTIPGMPTTARGTTGGGVSRASGITAAEVVPAAGGPVTAATAGPGETYYDPALGMHVTKAGVRPTTITPATPTDVAMRDPLWRYRQSPYSTGTVLGQRSSVGLRVMQANTAQMRLANMYVPPMARGLTASQMIESEALAAEAAAAPIGITSQMRGILAMGRGATPRQAFEHAYGGIPGSRYLGPGLGGTKEWSPMTGLPMAGPMTEEEAAAAERTLRARAAGGLRGAAGTVGKYASLGIGKLGGAAMIGTTGVIVSDMVGSAVKGSVGGAIKEIGKDASIGAALGSMFGPEGMAGGAIVGGLYGTFKHFFSSKSAGQTAAGSLSAGFGGAQRPQLQKTVATAVDEMTKLTTQTRPRYVMAGRAGVQRVDGKVTVDVSALSVENQAKYMRAARTAGLAVAQQLQAGWNQYKFPDEPTMFMQLRTEMKRLPAASQGYAIQSAYKFAQGLEKQGRLVKGSAAQMLRDAKNEFPAFTQYLGLQATASVKTFAAAMDFTNTRNKIHDTLNKIAYTDFPELQDTLKTTSGTVYDKAKAMVRDLKGIQENGTGPMRKQATKDIQAVKDSVFTNLTKAASLTESKMADISGSIQGHSKSAASDALTYFSQFAANVAAGIAGGVVASGKGMKLIDDAANAVLVAFGGTAVPIPYLKNLTIADITAGISTPQGRSALANYGTATPANLRSQGANAPKKAVGGLLQVGNRGERGGDNVPLSIMVGKGEQVAVFNAQQQAVMDKHLSGYGGLAGMFAQNPQPHYSQPRRFAAGGMLSYGQLEGLWTSAGGPPADASLMAAIALAESGGADVVQQGQPFATTGWGYWQITPGGPQYLDPMTNAREAVAKFRNAGNRPTPWTTYTSGAYRQFLQGGVPVMGGAGVPTIKAPKVEGAGLPGAVAQHALNAATKQANAYIAKKAATLAPAGGGAGGPAFHHGKYTFPLPQGSWHAGSVDQGWDISAPGNTPEFALASGVVIGHGISGFGQWAPILRLDDGSEVYYGHAGPQGELPIGTRVKAGQVIGSVGPGIVGISTGPHLEIGFYPPGGMGAGAAMKQALGYREGGMIYATSGLPGQHHQPGSVIHPGSTKVKSKKGTTKKAAKQKGHGMTGAELGALAKASSTVSALETDLTIKLAQYGSLQSRYSTDEGQAQYLSDDGSLNAAGIAKKTTDDQDLLTRAQAILKDYQDEETPVVTQLTKWLGQQSTTQAKIDADNKKLKKVNAQIAGLAPAETALSKPTKDEVTPILAAETGVRNKWNPIIDAAVKAQKSFHGTTLPSKATKAQKAAAAAADKKKRAALADAVTLAQSAEHNAINPLNITLAAARAARAKHRDETAAARYKLRRERDGLNTKKKAITDQIKTLKGILTGSGGAEGDNTKIGLLEQIGNKLGTLMWDAKSGKFTGINTTDQGAMFDEQTTIDSLNITLGQDANLKVSQPSDQQALADANAIAQYWQNIAMQNAQEAYVAEHQGAVLGGMAPFFPSGPGFNAYQLPPYAGSFAQGGIVPGPVGAARTAIVHGHEEITPPGTGGGNVHLHFANGMEWLKDFVSASVEDTTRGMARRAARRMPSRGGGMVVMT